MITVFCGSAAGSDPAYATAAAVMGRALAARGEGVVTGGGSIGLMGALADAVLASGGEIVGVITERLDALELGHPGLTEPMVVPDMHARKKAMADRARAFIAMPGGFGTLEELFEAVTWSQLNIHAKPVGLLNVDGYFDSLVAFLDHAVDAGFLRPPHRRLLVVREDPDALLDALDAVEIPRLEDVLGLVPRVRTRSR